MNDNLRKGHLLIISIGAMNKKEELPYFNVQESYLLPNMLGRSVQNGVYLEC